VGCPFDIVRSVWPRYFDGRVAGDAPATWLNVFAPLDVLGSNFIDGDDDAVVPEHVTPRRRPRGAHRGWVDVGESGEGCRHPVNVLYQSGPLGQRASALQALMLSGFKVHSMYWDDEDSTDVGAVRSIVTHLLDDASSLTPVIELPGTASSAHRNITDLTGVDEVTVPAKPVVPHRAR
jgi:hypothetical protein